MFPLSSFKKEGLVEGKCSSFFNLIHRERRQTSSPSGIWGNANAIILLHHCMEQSRPPGHPRGDRTYQLPLAIVMDLLSCKA
jgi:hypothetical protein